MNVKRAGRPAVLALGFFAFLSLVQAADPPAKDLVAKLKGVGKEGAGNVEATRAWKALVARGPEVLPDLLAGMNDEDATSSNWIRPAVDAICEKASDKLDKSVLEKAIDDKKNSGVARRLAYEWLVKIDGSAPGRYLPKMLSDRSPELRREAVETVIKEAKASLEKKEKDAARASYQRAFAAACDPEQVDEIAKALKELGIESDVAGHLGFVRSWHLISPFDSTGSKGFGVAYPPEKEVNLEASYKGKDGKDAKWTLVTTKDAHGMVDLNKEQAKHKGAVAYAYAELASPEQREVQFRIGCITAFKVYLNGKEIFAQEEYHHGMRIDQYTARGMLKKGKNTILLKVCQNEQKEPWAQDWKFQLRLTDFVGAGVPFIQPSTKKAAFLGEVRP